MFVEPFSTLISTKTGSSSFNFQYISNKEIRDTFVTKYLPSQAWMLTSEHIFYTCTCRMYGISIHESCDSKNLVCHLGFACRFMIMYLKRWSTRQCQVNGKAATGKTWGNTVLYLQYIYFRKNWFYVSG